MKTWIDFDAAPVFVIPLTDPVADLTVCEGMLIEGPQGWGEFSPPAGCDDRQAARWLTAAIEGGTVGWPDPVRGWVPVAVPVPSVSPARAREIVAAAGCRTAAVRVGDRPDSLAGDIARLEAVRDVLGPSGAIRCDVNGNWDIDAAAASIPALDRAAGGLEFVEQPCRTVDDVAALRRRIDVPIAIDQSIRDAIDPLRLALAEAAGDRDAAAWLGGLALAGVLPDAGFAHTLAGALLLTGDLVSDGRSLIPVDGQLPVAPMPPGPDAARLERFGATDPETVARWRGLLASVQRFL